MKRRLFMGILSILLLFSLMGCSEGEMLLSKYSEIFNYIDECYNLELETTHSVTYAYNKVTHIVYIISYDGITPLISENGYYFRYNEESSKVLELTPKVQESLLSEKEGK